MRVCTVDRVHQHGSTVCAVTISHTYHSPHRIFPLRSQIQRDFGVGQKSSKLMDDALDDVQNPGRQRECIGRTKPVPC